MSDDDIQQTNAILNALVDAAHASGMKLKAGCEVDLLAAIQAKGVTAAVTQTGLELSQGSTLMVISECMKTLRREHEQWFIYDARHAAPDVIGSRADFHGTPQEILARKVRWISEHSQGEYEQLPKDAEEARRRSVIPSAVMDRASYLCMSVHDRSNLAELVGPSGISRIMQRTK